jgi:DNA uptake protein ComE-like DNA-binding protein
MARFVHIGTACDEQGPVPQASRRRKKEGPARTHQKLNGWIRMVDLNTASLEELQTLPGVDLRAAYDLLLWRPYLTWQEVSEVPGFDAERAAQLRRGGALVGLPEEPRWRAESRAIRRPRDS